MKSAPAPRAFVSFCILCTLHVIDKGMQRFKNQQYPLSKHLQLPDFTLETRVAEMLEHLRHCVEIHAEDNSWCNMPMQRMQVTVTSSAILLATSDMDRCVLMYVLQQAQKLDGGAESAHRR